jgi:myo-inositol-1(or 4)-monophosphatase
LEAVVPKGHKIASIVADITAHVQTAGQIALQEQRAMDVSDRTYKADNSVVTEADRKVEDFLVERIGALHPAANIVTEESRHPFDPEKTLTFAIDPIDGTDVFSQGMPGWCVSVGLLDGDLTPIAGVIFAPRLDLLIVANGHRGATLNGSAIGRVSEGSAAAEATSALPPPRPARSISAHSNLMVTSRIHKQLDLSGYIGKIRGIGSAALHLCFHLIYPAVIGALEGPGVHIWDIAAAHAINRAQGQDLRHLSGSPIDYAPMINGEPGNDVVMAGREPTLRALRDVLKRLAPDRR